MSNAEELQRGLWGSFFRGNKALFAANMLLSVPRALINLLGAYTVSRAIDVVSGQGGATFQEVALLAVAVLVAELCIFLVNTEIFPRFMRRAVRQYRNAVFGALLQKDIGAIDREGSSGYLSALTNDVLSMETSYLEKVFNLLRDVVLFVGTLGLMLSQSVPLTLVAVVLGGIPFCVGIATGGRLAKNEKLVSDESGRFVALVTDLLSGFSLIKGFRAERRFEERFEEGNSALEDAKYQRRRISLRIQMLGQVSNEIAQIGVVLVGIALALGGYGLTAGSIMMFLQLMNYIFLPVRELPEILAARRAAVELVEKIATALAESPEDTGGVALAPAPTQGISARGLTFSYGEGEPVLRGLSAEFSAGGCYALVGGSGSGKSTLLSLLVGSARSYGGSLAYDGTELRDASAPSLARAVSLVSQDVFIFDGSVRDNITMYGDVDEEELSRVVRLAGLSELVRERGLDYPCGTGGAGLSGGERQRISIARSLLRGSGVLLLDEATSALDQATADQVTRSILALDGVTRIMVTHRLDAGLLARFDKVLMLRDGKIEESGSFDELMERRGYFYALYTVGQASAD